jgi:nitronate monooxygenase
VSKAALDFFKQLKVPVIQAPMAGGINNPAMAAASANAGGVGSFGFAYSTPEKIEADLEATRVLTAGPVNANFFVFSPVDAPKQEEIEAACRSLEELPGADGIQLNSPKAPYFPDLEKQIEPIWKIRPALLTFHFGIPHQSFIEKAKSRGILVGITATNLQEAIQIEKAGADFIVAQGIEAGGHRGIFNPHSSDDELNAFDLLIQLKKVCTLPLVSAGGIMTPEDVKKFMDAGASAVQMGTAFLTTSESTASPAHKRYLLQPEGRHATFTWGFSGRPAQGIDNEFMKRMKGKPILPFPIQNTLTGPIRQKAGHEDQGEYQSLWCGTRFNQCQDISISDLMSRISSVIKN